MRITSNKSKIQVVERSVIEAGADTSSEYPDFVKKLYDAAKDFMMECGFPEDEVDEYLFVEVNDVDSEYFEGGQAIKAEVRAELDFDTMFSLLERLNPIVSEYDSDAYFDMDSPGIATSFIDKESVVSCESISSSTCNCNSYISSSDDSELWYIEPQYRWDNFKSWVYNAYEMRVDQILPSEIESYKAAYSRYQDACAYSEEVDKSKSDVVSSASNLPDYGGAFDVDPHMFFTKEEIMEFAYDVEEKLNEDPELSERRIRYYDVYIVDYNRLVVDFTDDEGYEFSGQVKIDMRKIRKPSDINKYQDDIVNQVKEQAYDAYEMVEGCDDIRDRDDMQVYGKINLADYTDGYVEMRDGEPNFVYDNEKDARRGVSYSKMGDIENDLGSHEYKVMKLENGELKEIESSEEVEAGIYDVPERSLNPPDPPKSWTESESGELEMEIVQTFEITEDGELDFDEYDDYLSYPDQDYYYESEFGYRDVEICEAVDVADNLWEIFESKYILPQLPVEPGTYVATGILCTPFEIDNIQVYPNNARYEEEYEEEYDFDDVEISIDWKSSSISNLDIKKK